MGRMKTASTNTLPPIPWKRNARFLQIFMASAATAGTIANRSKKAPTITSICASFVRSVFLHDWWLIRAETDSNGRILGVGGFASRESQAIRAFRSTTIAKRHDTVTVETADGITITISGFINRSLTLENGFPSEQVCNHFLFGFPYYWEQYAARCFIEQSVNRGIPSKVSRCSDDDIDSFPPVPLDDLPVTRVRDLLMSGLGDTGNCGLSKCILDDILQICGGDVSKSNAASVHSNMQSKYPGKAMDSALVGTPSNFNKTMGMLKRNHDRTPNHDKTKIQKHSEDADGILYATDVGIKESHKSIPESKKEKSSSSGVTTRSMTRLNNLTNKEKNFSPSSSVTQRHGEALSASEASGNQFEGMVDRNALSASRETKLSVNPCGRIASRRNGPNGSYENIMCWEVDGKQIPDNSAVRRSNRLRNIKQLAASSN